MAGPLKTPEIYMFQPTYPDPQDYEDLQTHMKHVWKIKTPPIDKPITQAEASLNWQAQNSVAQNHTLQEIL